MNDSSKANPARLTKSAASRVDAPTSDQHGRATADQEIGTFMKVLARLDPLSGRHAAKLVPLSVSGAAPKAPSQPRARSRNQGKAAR